MPATKPKAEQIEERAQELLNEFLREREEGMIYGISPCEKPEIPTETDAIEAWKLIAKLNREGIVRYLEASALTDPNDVALMQDVLHGAMQLEREAHRADWLTGLNSE